MRRGPVPMEEKLAALDWIRDNLPQGPDRTADDPDPLLTQREVAELAGVVYGTVEMWKQRSREDWPSRGKLDRPFPAPVPSALGGLRWRAISAILPWLYETRRWPRGVAGRPMSRKETSSAA